MADLTLVGGRAVDVKEKSPAELVFDYKILPEIQEVATGIHSRGGRFACRISSLVTSDSQIADDLEKLLREKSLVKVDLKPGMSLPGDLALRLVKAYSGWYVIVKSTADFDDDNFPPAESFVFKSEDYSSENPFRGQKFYDVRDILVEKYGSFSIEVQNIDRVTVLIRKLLYGENVPTVVRHGLAVELRTLRVGVGAAAAAVIADFLGDYSEHEGWTTIDLGSISSSVDRMLENSSAADSKLQVGDISLYDLV